MSLSPVLRGVIIQRDKRRCRYCKRHSGSWTSGPDGRPWHVDHIIPRSGGGSDDPSNLALACQRCNLSKHVHAAPKPRPPVKPKPAATPQSGWHGRTPSVTLRIIAPGHRLSGKLHIGRALWRQIGSPARIDVVRDQAGRLRIRRGGMYAVGHNSNTIPRILIGATTIDSWGLTPGYYSARIYRGGILVGAPIATSPTIPGAGPAPAPVSGTAVRSTPGSSPAPPPAPATP